MNSHCMSHKLKQNTNQTSLLKHTVTPYFKHTDSQGPTVRRLIAEETTGLWYVTPYSLVDTYQYFREQYSYRTGTLIRQALGPSETSVYMYQTVRRHITSDDLYSQAYPSLNHI